MNISYMKNSLVKALYSPEIQVTADNGGKAALFDILRPIAGLTSSASFSSPLIFEYTYPQKIALMCTKTGITTFKIITGTAFKTHTMSCKNSVTDAKYIEALQDPIAIPGTPNHQYFKVTDRWGNPVAGVTVRLSSSGPGTLTSATDVVTWNDGIVAADVLSAESGNQMISAVIHDPDNITQAATGTSQTNSVVVWGRQDMALLPASKKITFNFYNLVGQKATILEGKAKSYFNVTLPSQTFVKKYAKGKHKLKITVGSLVQTITVTVP
jgi:hypothetical protein